MTRHELILPRRRVYYYTIFFSYTPLYLPILEAPMNTLTLTPADISANEKNTCEWFFMAISVKVGLLKYNQSNSRSSRIFNQVLTLSRLILIPFVNRTLLQPLSICKRCNVLNSAYPDISANKKNIIHLCIFLISMRALTFLPPTIPRTAHGLALITLSPISSLRQTALYSSYQAANDATYLTFPGGGEKVSGIQENRPVLPRTYFTSTPERRDFKHTSVPGSSPGTFR